MNPFAQKTTADRVYRKLICSLVVVVVVVIAAVPRGTVARDSAEVADNWRSPHQPIQQLKNGIPAPEGKLTLFADYNDIGDDRIALYLINRTNEPVIFPAQDESLYLKQEAQDSSGRWVRTEQHRYSWCGNSYHRITLEPGRFIRGSAWFPRKGEPSNVRYSTYGDVPATSNAGSGWILPDEARRAKFDVMAMKGADISLIQAALFEAPWGGA